MSMHNSNKTKGLTICERSRTGDDSMASHPELQRGRRDDLIGERMLGDRFLSESECFLLALYNTNEQKK